METGIELNVGEIDLQSLMDKVICGKPSHPSRRMGASSIGCSCDRQTYIAFHWAVPSLFEGDNLRTFDMGHVMEAKMAEWLIDCGLELTYIGDAQAELEIMPHLVCYPDGLIMSGVPGAEKTIHNWECKIMNDSTFKTLIKKGLKETKPEHYAQVQLEMYGWSQKLMRKVDRTLYTVFNRATSQIYALRIKYDEEEVKKILDKYERIMKAETLPEPISRSPEWLTCKMCNYSHFCHFSKESLQVNCRTCTHATPEEDGTWSCRMDKMCGWGIGELTNDMQKTGCDFHCFNPSLVPYPWHEDKSTDYSAAYEMPDGSIVLNGYGGVNSHDLWKTGRTTNGEQVEGDISF